MAEYVEESDNIVFCAGRAKKILLLCSLKNNRGTQSHKAKKLIVFVRMGLDVIYILVDDNSIMKDNIDDWPSLNNLKKCTTGGKVGACVVSINLTTNRILKESEGLLPVK